MSFASHLERKIRQELENEMDFSSENTLSAREEIIKGTIENHLGFLLGQVAKSELPRGSYPQKPPPPRPAHKLNLEQSQAFNYFLSLEVKIPAGFSARELRRAFRQAALKTHPDHGGNPQAFLQSQSAYRALSTVLGGI